MAYSLETSSVKTIVPGAEVSGFADVVARQKINELSSTVPQLSAGEGIDISTVDGKTVITNNISAGTNISLVYDLETNTYRIDSTGGNTGAYVPLSATECEIGNGNISLQTAFTQGVNNTAKAGSLAQGINCSAYGYGISQGNSNTAGSFAQAFGTHTVMEYDGMAIGRFNKTSAGASFVIGNGYQSIPSMEEIRSDSFIVFENGSVSAAGKISANGVELGAGKTYTGVAPIQVNNTTDQISITGESLSAGPGIDMFSSGGYVVISSYGGNAPTTYCYVYPAGYGELDLDTLTAYNKVTVFAPGDYGPDRMLYGTDDNLNHSQKVMPSGLWVEALKNRKEGGQFSWSLINSGWISYNNMWEGD